MSFHETQNQNNVPVVKGGKVVGYVSRRATSVGAAKVAGSDNAQWSTRAIPDRSYSPGWVVR